MSESAAAAAPPPQEKVGDDEDSPRLFTFPSHQSHMLNLARMCKQNKEFTDCVIQCDPAGGGGSLRAHRLVLGSASRFLRRVFDEMPAHLSESTIVVPGVRLGVVEALLEFLYSGEMRVKRADTADLQLLIETLQIDPELISVEVQDEPKEEEEAGAEGEGEGRREEKRKEEEQKQEEAESSPEGHGDEKGDGGETSKAGKSEGEGAASSRKRKSRPSGESQAEGQEAGGDPEEESPQTKKAK